MKAGVYIHIPFCAGKCPYCDFYSVAGPPALFDVYTEALLRAIDRAPALPAADTLYFGGGTPSLLGAERLLRIRDAACRRFGIGEGGEVTVELNPASGSGALLRALADGGVTRLSVGVQSLDDRLLRVLGRKHTADEALATLHAAKSAGFAQLSADLMLAVPGQTPDGVRRDVDRLAQAGVTHLSAYLLKLEPGTAFRDRYDDPDDDLAADCYLAAVEQCGRNGLEQYEISNFAAGTTAQSRHNRKYWTGTDYLGVGPAAHSFVNGRRFYFPRDVGAFCAAENPWTLAVDDGPGGGDDERLMLALRLSDGVDLRDFPRGDAMRKKAKALEQHRLVRLCGDRLSLTAEGFLLSNTVIVTLLEA